MYIPEVCIGPRNAQPSRILIQQMVSANMAPRNQNKNSQNGAGFLSEACPVFQLGQFTSNDLHASFFPSVLCVTPCDTLSKRRVCISRKKANTSVTYMDAVVSTKKSFNILQPTSEGIGNLESGETS